MAGVVKGGAEARVPVDGPKPSNSLHTENDRCIVLLLLYLVVILLALLSTTYVYYVSFDFHVVYNYVANT